ncbi:MAG: hypothetical protein ACOZBW_05260, partial [Thermodesulfobacteriota bacterium]
IVVIMIPIDFIEISNNKSIFDYVGFPKENTFSTKYFINYIEYGDTIPIHDHLYWFSPDSKNDPVKVEINKDITLIETPNIKLTLEKKGESRIFVRRLK